MSALVLTLNGKERPGTRRYLPRAEALRTLAAVEVGYRGSRQAKTVRIRRLTTRLVVTSKSGGVVRLEVR